MNTNTVGRNRIKYLHTEFNKESVENLGKYGKVCFYLRHKKIEQADLDQIFSESKFLTIAHKNQKRITAATHYLRVLGTLCVLSNRENTWINVM